MYVYMSLHVHFGVCDCDLWSVLYEPVLIYDPYGSVVSSVLYFKHSPLKKHSRGIHSPALECLSLIAVCPTQEVDLWSAECCQSSPALVLHVFPSCFCCRSCFWHVFSFMCWCTADDNLEWFNFKDSLRPIRQWLSVHSGLCIKCLSACLTWDHLGREWDCLIDVVNAVMAVKQRGKSLRFALNSPVGINMWIKTVSLT